MQRSEESRQSFRAVTRNNQLVDLTVSLLIYSIYSDTVRKVAEQRELPGVSQ
jgi:hypothetical protein